MPNRTKVEILERALAREKKARKKAETILEEKSTELFLLSEQLAESNKKLSAAVKEKTSRLKGVFDTIIDPFVIIDLQGIVVDMNQAAVDLFGFDHREKRVNLMDLVLPEYKEYTSQAFRKLYEKGSFSNYIVKITTFHQEEKIVQVNASLIYDAQGKPTLAQGIARDVTAETELRRLHQEQKKQLDIIMDNSPVGISLSTSNFDGLILANKTLTHLLGYTQEEISKVNPYDLTHPDDREWSLDYLKRLKKGEINQYAIEKRYIKKNGDIIWAKTSAKAVEDNKSKIKYQVATVEDITKEKEIFQKLQDSQSRLSSLIVNLQTGVLLEDEHSKIVLTNERFCKMFKIDATPRDLEGLPCESLVKSHKDLFVYPEKFVERIALLIENKNRILNEELLLKDGRIFKRDFIPIYQDNKYKGHLWSYTDITLKRKYKTNLKKQKEKYSSIIANMNLGLVETDLEDKIIYTNNSFCKMSAYAKNELMGKEVPEFLLTPKSAKQYALQKEKIKNQQADSFEISVYSKDDKLKYWLVSSAPNYNVNGKLVGHIGIYLDITQLKKLEKQKEQLLASLEKQNEHLNEYAHIVSHDLKSPLRNISALLSWTKEDFENQLGEESLVNLDLIQSKVEKMDHLIENILKYSSIESDILFEENVAIADLIQNIKELIYIPEHINLLIEGEMPVIKADKTRMQQVFQNLLSNAVNYIDKEEGFIRVSCSQNKTHYQFAITDNGIGIAPEHHEKIFKIFNSLGNHEKSTGIGLSIVKKIIDLYQGKIWLTSEPGKGTTFYFTLKKSAQLRALNK